MADDDPDPPLVDPALFDVLLCDVAAPELVPVDAVLLEPFEVPPVVPPELLVPPEPLVPDDESDFGAGAG